MLAHSTGQVNTWTVERRHQDGIEVALPAQSVEPYELLHYFRGIVGRATAFYMTLTIFWQRSKSPWLVWLVWLVAFCLFGGGWVGGGVFLLKVFNFFRISKFYQLPKRRVPTKEPVFFLRKNINKQKSLNSPSEVRLFSIFQKLTTLTASSCPSQSPSSKNEEPKEGQVTPEVQRAQDIPQHLHVTEEEIGRCVTLGARRSTWLLGGLENILLTVPLSDTFSTA